MEMMIDCDELIGNKVFRNEGNRKKRVKQENIRRESRCEKFHDLYLSLVVHAGTTLASECGHIMHLVRLILT